MREPRKPVPSRSLLVLTVIAVALGYGLTTTTQAEDHRDRTRRPADQSGAQDAARSAPEYDYYMDGRGVIQGEFIPSELATTPDMPSVVTNDAPAARKSGNGYFANPNPPAAGPQRLAQGTCPTSEACMTAGCDPAGATCAGVPYRLWDIDPGTLEPQADGICDWELNGGIGSSCDCPIIWMVSYEVQPGAEVLASWVVAWAQTPMEGNEAHLGFYLDNSGATTPEEADPSNASLLVSKTVLVPEGAGSDPNCLVNYALDPVDYVVLEAGDIFYVAATYVPTQFDGTDSFPQGTDAICAGATCPDDTGDGRFFAGRNWIGVSLGMTDPPGPPGEMGDGSCSSSPPDDPEAGCVPACEPQESTCGIVGLIEDVGAAANTLNRNWVLGAASVPAVCGNGDCEPPEDQCDPDNLLALRCPEDCGLPEATETDCLDNFDNDCNGLTDCNDGAQCPLVPTEVGSCGDGLDNDCDAIPSFGAGGGTDCNDPDCYEVDAACQFTCAGGAIAEGETLCTDGQLSGDNFNGGCNATTPVWDVNPMAPDQEYCGTTGNFFTTCGPDDDCGANETCDAGNCRTFCGTNDDCTGAPGGGEGTCDASTVSCTTDVDCGDGSAVGACMGGFCQACTGGQTPARDTDWWRVNVATPEKEITVCVTAEFPAQFGFVDDNQGVCDNAAFLNAATATPFVESCTTECLSLGDWTVFVSVPFGWDPNTTERYECGREYQIRIEEADCVAVDSVCTLDVNGDLACQFPNQERNGPSVLVETASIRSDTNLFENGTTQAVADTFETISGGDITEICWWGGYRNLAGVDADCGAPPADNFTVTYYNNDNAQDAIPGSILAGPFNVSPSVVPTNLSFGSQPQLTEYSYSVTHPPVAVASAECYWVEIQNNTSATTCVWEWSTSGSLPYDDGPGGDGVAAIREDSAAYANGDSAPYDLSWCVGPDPILVSPTGCQISGGCCDQVAGTCVDDSTYADCLGDDNRFAQDGCAALSPECGSDECVPDACFYCPLNGDPGSAKSTQADMGGGNGACDPDGACDGNDRFAALNCFSNSNTTNDGPFPCETSPPAAGNTDAGGPGISCGRDGVCDGNDAFHALACFSNSDSTGTPPYPCPCAGPAPSAPGGDSIVTTELKTGITVRAPKNARPGDLVSVDVYLDDAIKALRGYQLHLDVTGGAVGEFELVDISIAQRSDRALANAAGTWTAFNRSTAQLVVGMDDAAGVASDADAYLATYTYRVPRGAAGTFAVEVQYDDSTLTPKARTFVFTSHGALVDVSHTAPALITVPDIRTRDRRLGMK